MKSPLEMKKFASQLGILVNEELFLNLLFLLTAWAGLFLVQSQYQEKIVHNVTFLSPPPLLPPPCAESGLTACGAGGAEKVGPSQGNGPGR